MNAIEIRGLKKSFRGLYALDGLDMTVPVGAIYGFIGENGSGKSTTEKLICGHLVPSGGKIRLFGKSYKDAGVRARVGALIENTGCFPNSSVYQNLMMQAINLNLADPDAEIQRVLEIVRMEDSAQLKFKKCSLGMKQRIGIAMALMGDPGRPCRLCGDLSGISCSHDDLSADPGEDAPRRQILQALDVRVSRTRRRGGTSALRRVHVDLQNGCGGGRGRSRP